MARANHNAKIPAIQAEFRTGAYTIKALAFKHKVSVGFVAKHTANLEKDAAAIVNAGVAFKQGLATDNEFLVNAVHEIVNERTKHIQVINNAAIKNMLESMKTECNNQQDFRFRADTVLKTKETVLGKTPDTAIQINNNESGNDVAARIRARQRDRLG